MVKHTLSASLVLLLAACAVPGAHTAEESDAAIAQRRAEIQQMDEQDYQTARKRRRDMIEDIGKLQMNAAEAINKSKENSSKQNINIFR